MTVESVLPFKELLALMQNQHFKMERARHIPVYPHHFPSRVDHNLREEGIAIRSLFRVAGNHVALKPLGYLCAPVMSRARVSALKVGFDILK